MKEEPLLLLSDLQKLINQVVLIDYTIIILGGNIMKKVTKIFAFAVAICMLFSVTTTTAFAEETITNMTYDEWLAEQENNNTACK